MRISIHLRFALGGALGSMGRYWMGLRIFRKDNGPAVLTMPIIEEGEA
jgi:fluoride ion exporter CrcB/FEX